MAATHLRRFYLLADRKYGHLFDKYRQDVPKNLATAHVAVVNPRNLNTPAIKYYHRGFMMASISAARRAEVDWDKLTDPTSCAYAWFMDFNRSSYLLYTTYPKHFTTPNEDFWRCAYLKLTLEDPAFNALWAFASPDAGKTGGVYEQLRVKVEAIRGSLPGWTVERLRKAVLLDLETVFSLAKLYGSLTSTGPGKPPYMSGDDAGRVFVE